MSVLKDHYYRLGSEVADERLQAAASLLKDLKEVNNEKDWDYALGRLIKGLSSSRQAARLGFSMALTEVIHELITEKNNLTVDTYIGRVKKSSQVTGSMKGSEIRSILFGKLFGLQALLNSKVLFLPSLVSEEETRTFINMLIELAVAKSWLRESAIFTLSQFVAALLASEGKSINIITFVLETLHKHHLTFTVEGLGIYMTIPSSLRKEASIPLTLSGFGWKNGDPLFHENLSTLAKVLKDAEPVDEENSESKKRPETKKNALKQKGSWNPQLPFAWNLLKKHFSEINETESPTASEENGKKRKKHDSSKSKKKAKTESSSEIAFKDFWNVCVDRTMFTEKSSPERKYWGFEIFILFFQGLPAKELSLLFSEGFMVNLMSQSSKLNKVLNKMSTKVLNTIIQETQSDLSKVLPALEGIIGGETSYWNFDFLTKSKVVDSLVGVLSYIEVESISSKRAQNLVNDIKDALLKRFSASFKSQANDKNDEEKNSNDNTLKWVIDKLLLLERSTKRFSISNSFLEDLFKFYLQHAFFKSESRSVSSYINHVTQERLNSLLSDVISQKRKGHLWSFYCIEQIKKNETKEDQRLLFEPEGDLQLVKDESLKLLLTVIELQKKGSETRKEQQYCFELLLSMSLLQLYSGDGEAIGVLEELKDCYESAFAGSEDTEVKPSVVLTDILLSFISKKSSLMKKLSTIVWEHFLCTKDLEGRIRLDDESFKLLFDVLDTRENEDGQKALFDGEAEFAGEDDEDENAPDDDANEASEPENDSSEDNEDEDSSEGEDSMDDDNSDEEEDPEKKRKDTKDEVEQMTTIKLAKALGISTSESGEVKFDEIDSFGEDNDDEESDLMDDEQMMAMDDELSKIFRERRSLLTANSTSTKKTEQAEAKEQMSLFKLRVLDLLDAFSKMQPNSVYNLSFIRPIVNLINNTHDKTIGVKAHKLLRTRISKIRINPKEVKLLYNLDKEQEKFKAGLFEDIKWLQNQAGRYSSNQSHLLACSQSCITISKALVALDKDLIMNIIAIYTDTLGQWATNPKNKIQANLFFDFINWLNAKRANMNQDK